MPFFGLAKAAGSAHQTDRDRQTDRAGTGDRDRAGDRAKSLGDRLPRQAGRQAGRRWTDRWQRTDRAGQLSMLKDRGQTGRDGLPRAEPETGTEPETDGGRQAGRDIPGGHGVGMGMVWEYLGK